MIVVQIPFYLHNVRHKPMWTFILLLLIVCIFLGNTSADGETESPPPTTTSEPGKFHSRNKHYISTFVNICTCVCVD